jgi:tRNA pseudouridine38-40 synthase
MRTIRLTLAYDGTEFAGWQRQGQRRTVQATLEATLEKITGQRTAVLASGRTDAGVHALGQVASFETDSRLPPKVILRALNAELPEDIVVFDAAEVRAGFHPTHHALRKRYRYVIYDGPVRNVFQRRYCWHFTYGRLDAEAMRRAGAALIGTHDFSSFETSGSPRKTSIRTVFDLSVQRGRAGEQGRGVDQDFVTVEVEANGFLYNMVRAIVGTLAEVGRGVQSENWVAEVLAAADRRLAGRTAPPQGLFLVHAVYE